MSPEDLFKAHRGLVERLIAHACRRCHFQREDCEDFGSTVWIKLISDDYGVFRQFKNKSKIETYLTVVVKRHLLDHLNHRWGKRRASAEAERLGPVAILLERLLRDGSSLDQACESLRTQGVSESPSELARLAERLPLWAPRRIEGEDQLVSVPTTERSPEQRLLEKQSAASRGRILAALKKVLASLPKEDRGIINMWVTMPVSQIARCCGIEQKPLYRRIEKIFRTLRQAVEREGVHRDDLFHDE
jgi:RNA polymerase sigma factor (sigma-70 family)